MRGNVIGFDHDTNTGAISGYDGVRYDFVTQHWQATSRPRHGDLVDFQAQGGRAHDIRLIEPEYAPLSFWQFYFSPSGRISRSQFWLRWVLPITIIVTVLIIAIAVWVVTTVGTSSEDLETQLTSAFFIYALIFAVATTWTDCVVLAKRIHDRDKPGWFVFLCLAPRVLSALIPGIGSAIFSIIGLVIFVWFFVEFGCLRGTIGGNRFGPDPVRSR